MSSRKQEKAALKQARLAKEQAAQQAKARSRRIKSLAGIASAAVIAVAIIVIISSGSNQSSGDYSKAPNGQADVTGMLQGIPQNGDTIGNPNAPLSMVEFADLKCPFCSDFDVTVMPSVIKNYVRTGKLKVQLKLLHFVGENSRDGSAGMTPGDTTAAARFAVATQSQKRYWNFAQLLYFNHQDESNRYAGTKEFLAWISKGAGIDYNKAAALQDKPQVTKQLDAYTNDFASINGTGTPTVLLGKSGSVLSPVDFSKMGYKDYQAFSALLDEYMR